MRHWTWIIHRCSEKCLINELCRHKKDPTVLCCPFSKYWLIIRLSQFLCLRSRAVRSDHSRHGTRPLNVRWDLTHSIVISGQSLWRANGVTLERGADGWTLKTGIKWQMSQVSFPADGAKEDGISCFGVVTLSGHEPPINYGPYQSAPITSIYQPSAECVGGA